jgi:excisionase family DNA binding protein
MIQLLTVGVEQAAATLGLSKWTIRQYIREGKIAVVRIGRRVLIEPGELERLVREGRNGAERNGSILHI